MTYRNSDVLGKYVGDSIKEDIARAINIDAHPLVDVRGEELKAAYQRIDRLEADLLECLEFFKNHYDVLDGCDGQQWPNIEMQLGTMIQETLYGPGNF